MKLLIQLENDKVKRKIPLNRTRYSLGRSSECEIVFDDAKISRIHAELIEEGDSFRIVDKNSTNHTYVNDIQVSKKRLSSGDRINLSKNITLVYLRESEHDEKISSFIDLIWGAVKHNDFLRLNEVTSRIISLESLNTILAIIIEEVVNICNAQRGFIALMDEKGNVKDDKIVPFNMDLTIKDPSKAVYSQSTILEAIKNRKTINVRIDPAHDIEPTQSVMELELHSVMCTPLIYGERLLGVLYVDSKHAISEFNEIEQFLFQMLSKHASIAIENVLLYEGSRKRNELLREEIRQSEERYRQLVERFPESILVVSDGKIIFANTTSQTMLQTESNEQLIGQTIERFIHIDFIPKFNNILEKSTQNGSVNNSLEARIRTIPGDELEVEIHISSIQFEGNDAILVLIRNIAEKKNLENEIIKRQKLESLALLAGGIAHDFRNILQIISGNLDLALLSASNDETKEHLELIDTALGRATNLSTQLLTFSKGGTPVTKASDVRKLIHEYVTFALSGSDIAFQVHMENDLPYVEIDPEQISHVIHNLVLNAKQAMQNGGKIVVNVRRMVLERENQSLSLAPGKFVEVSITDQGGGIPDSIVNKIFDPYFTTKKDGSGLGLASCYSIMQKHAGAISVESEPGKGATFKIFLPASKTIEIDLEDVKVEEDIYLKGRILFMDDEEMIRNMMKKMLTNLGARVDTVPDGECAVSFYNRAIRNNDPFDLVILDLTIRGGMGGVETIKQLREIDPNVKAIVASGYSMDPVMSNPSDYGFVGMVAKPFNIRELSKAIKAV